MKKPTLTVLMLSIWLFSAGYSQAQLPKITVDESTGDTLDLAERNKYGLFKNTESFRWAVFYAIYLAGK
jgi:hypothetical protein